MWTDQDDYDEETDIIIMTALEEHEERERQRKNTSKQSVKNAAAGNSGSCLVFILALIGLGVLPLLLFQSLFFSV